MEKGFFCCFCVERWIVRLSGIETMYLLVATTVLSTAVEAPYVTGGNITVVHGETSILPCTLADTREPVTQISWRKEPQTNYFLTLLNPPSGVQYIGDDKRFTFVGSFQNYSGSLQLSKVSLMDQGTYTCIFTLFPSGNIKGEMLLNVLVPPNTSLKDNNPILGKEEVSLATCMAAGSKPPAELMWLTGTLAKNVSIKTNTAQHANGTTTTVSTLFGVPTKEVNHHLVKCVIKSASMSKEESLSVNLQVYFSPIEVIIRGTAEDSFQCVTEANPKADFTWSRTDQLLPPSVTVEGPTIKFSTKRSDNNGIYHCEASNLYGSKRAYIYMHMETGDCTACWIIVGLFFLLSLAVAVYAVKTGICPWNIMDLCKAPPSSPERTEGEEETELRTEGS